MDKAKQAKLAALRAAKQKKKSELEAKRHEDLLQSSKSVAEAFADLKALVLKDRQESNEQLSKALVQLKEVANFKPAIEALEKAMDAKIGDIAQAVSGIKFDDSAVTEALQGLATTYEENVYDPSQQSQAAKDYIPYRRVIRLDSGQYVFDDTPTGTGGGSTMASFGIPAGGFPDEVLRNGDSIAVVGPDGQPIHIDVGDITVEVDDVGIKNESDVRINPSTEEKQDDIITLLQNLPQVIDNEIPGGLINSVNTAYTTFYDYKPGSTKIYLNGARQREGVGFDYVEAGGNDLTFAVSPLSGDTIIIDYMKA